MLNSNLGYKFKLSGYFTVTNSSYIATGSPQVTLDVSKSSKVIITEFTNANSKSYYRKDGGNIIYISGDITIDVSDCNSIFIALTSEIPVSANSAQITPSCYIEVK